MCTDAWQVWLQQVGSLFDFAAGMGPPMYPLNSTNTGSFDPVELTAELNQ
jgi:hypothetical protein